MAELVLKGLIPAFPTPVTGDHKVDRPALQALVRYMLDQGASGVVPLGGTGEFTALSPEARIAAIEATVEAASGKGSVVAGVLSPGIGDAIEAGRAFMRAGAEALMVIVPFYTRNSQQGVIDYFRRFRDAVDRPIVLYDNPARSHFIMAPDTIAAMAEEKLIIGMKASNTDLYHFDHVMERVGPGFAMLSGQDTLFAQQVAMGAQGGVLTSAVLVPGIWNETQALAQANDFAAAQKKQRLLNPLMDALFKEENPGPTRAALKMIGLDTGYSMLPLGRISDGLQAEIFAVLQNLHRAGILKTAPHDRG